MGFILLAVVLFVIAVASHFISTGVYNRIVRSGGKNAVVLRIIAFIVSFALIAAILCVIIARNVRIER
jgi:hypothetical protein